MGPEQELIAGRRPVEEAFVAGRNAHRLLVVLQRRQALERLVLHATNLRIPVVEVEGGTLTALAGFDGHQGIAIAVDRRRYATPDDILARAIERGEPPFVLALDSLEDPQNVGTLLRSAEAAGVHGVLFPTHRQAPLTPAAVKASAGAVEHLLLAPVDDLAAALADLHIRGLRVAGAEADAPLTAREADLRGPIAIVVGSEGQGLGPAIRRRTDVLMRIPMRGAIDSLNAAVAGSILLFEAVAQRGLPERSGPPPRIEAIAPPPGLDEAAPLEAPADGDGSGSAREGGAAAPQDPGPPEAEAEVEAPAKPKRKARAQAATPAAPAEPADEAPAPPPRKPRSRRPRAVVEEPPGSADGATDLADDGLLPGGPAGDVAPDGPPGAGPERSDDGPAAAAGPGPEGSPPPAPEPASAPAPPRRRRTSRA